MRVIVTDGNERVALAACRALVARGHEVHVIADTPFSLAGVSWKVRPHVIDRLPCDDGPGFVHALASRAEAVRADVLLPVTDASVEAVLRNRDALPRRVAIPLPSLETFRLASDKQAVTAMARDAGLDVPESQVLESPADFRPDPRWFPAVLKPHRSVSGGRKFSVAFVDNEDECRRALGALAGAAFPVLLQRRVFGDGVGVFLLRWQGRTVAAFGHRRIREKPPAGGVSVYRESVRLDPLLQNAAERLLERLDWHGAAMVECKQDRATGRYVFMELNGRLWGSLQLAVDAGINFPDLLVAGAGGESLRPVAGYRAGVRSRWFWGDVDHLYLRLTRSRSALHLDPAAPGRLKTLLELLRIRREDRNEVLRWRDPAPFLLETIRRLGGLLPRRRARHSPVAEPAVGASAG